ncbi:N-acetylmannosamine-6-phosphate 2-epimerase [Alphaproteobacteria bacterium]|nr:N-acetylmannosamine-6-phosphate 2-epimerase [Alphaproteobacteria bacterium]
MNNKNKRIVKNLKGSLIASCQPIPGGPLDFSSFILASAKASIIGGAKGLRIEGFKNLKVIKKNLNLPVIGIKKRVSKNYPIIITPLLSDVEKLSELGAEIIAFDSTLRERPYSVGSLISKIHSCKKIAMADCSTIKDAINAIENGANILSTTLSGYTSEKLPPKNPDFELLNQLIKKFKVPVIAEGRFNTPFFYKKAINLGAHAVVVGTALNRIELITKSFLDEI